jgi:hypothetical protein
MNGGTKAALLISCAGLVGCSASMATVEVRPIANPSAALARGGDALAVARGQLMLGNVGLALEGFRKAQRDNPGNPAALAGIGDCYAAMSRFDLAQSSYEAALALAPRDRTLLLGLASVFERSGQPVQAMAARAEANLAVPPAPPSTAVSPVAKVVAKALPQRALPAPNLSAEAPSLHAPVVSNLLTKAAQPAPVEMNLVAEAAPQRALPRPNLIAQAPSLPAPVVTNLLTKAAQPAPVEMNLVAEAVAEAPPAVTAVPQQRDLPIVRAAAQPMKLPAPSVGSITVELPPARPVHRVDTQAPVLAAAEFDYSEQVPAASVTVPLPPARPAPSPVREPRAEPALVATGAAPRLERLSSGEVALVTTGKPIWNRPQNLLAAASSVRWVALAASGPRPTIQVLNAARSEGLAASARAVLLDRGWRKLAIGDAPAVEAKSVVLYPKGREKLGKSLAAQFGVAARMVERDILVLVLGRDAVDRVSGQRKS